jgi:hypothetical protein
MSICRRTLSTAVITNNKHFTPYKLVLRLNSIIDCETLFSLDELARQIQILHIQRLHQTRPA